MNICIIRHGQTDFNIRGLCNDNPQTDVSLTPYGITQARAAAQALSGHGFDVIYTSELPRTHQTASIINEYHQAPMVQRGDLNDIHSGFDGLPVAHYFAAVGYDRMNVVPPGGESLRQFQQRINTFIDWLVTRPHHNVLVVAHEETLRIFSARFHGLNDEVMQTLSFSNCEYLCFENVDSE